SAGENSTGRKAEAIANPLTTIPMSTSGIISSTNQRCRSGDPSGAVGSPSSCIGGRTNWSSSGIRAFGGLGTGLGARLGVEDPPAPGLGHGVRQEVGAQLLDERLEPGPAGVDVELDVLADAHTGDPLETQVGQRAFDGTPLGVEDLALEHDVDGNSGHGIS